MFDFIAQFASAIVSTSKDIAQVVRRGLIERRFETAKSAIEGAKADLISEASNLHAQEAYPATLSVTWQDVLNLGQPFRARHERRLQDLEDRIVEDTEDNGDWFTLVDRPTVSALQDPRVTRARTQAETDLAKTLTVAIEAALAKFDTDCDAIAERAEGYDQIELRTLAATKREELLKVADARKALEEARDYLDAAKPIWAERVKASYRNALQDKLANFINEDRPKLIAGVERNRTAAHWIKKLLLDSESVPHAKLSGVYQLGDQHLQDQLINTVTLTVMEDGELVYRAREREAGGRFSFEKNYMDPSAKFWEQAASPPPDPEAKSPADRVLPFALRFIDQVRMPATSSARLAKNGSFDLRKDDKVNRVLLQFAGDVQGVPLDEDESRFRDLPYITDFPGTMLVTTWLAREAGRQISVALRPDGLLAVVVKLNDRKKTCDSDTPDAVIRLRTDYNEARLMSLLVMSLVTRVLNGADDERGFPARCHNSNRLHIPSYCIWPLQVDPQGAVTKAETILEQLDAGKLTNEAVPRWAVGWSPAQHEDAPVAEALQARFIYTTERHLRVLNSTEAGPIEVRKGVNENDALYKLTRWFKYTSLALGALWASAVLSTLVAANAYTTNELWAITLVFSLIGICRCLICWGLTARSREPVMEILPVGWLSRFVTALSDFTGGVVEIAFSRRWFLLAGPLILASVMIAAFVSQDLLRSLSGLFRIPETLMPSVSLDEAPKNFGLWGNHGDTATGFQEALYKGVWALPLLAIGLMRHGYMLLYELVLQRGLLQRKLTSMIGVQETWRAGRNLPSPVSTSREETPTPVPDKTVAINAALARMRARVTEDIEAARARFDKGSAANAALVAVIGLLAPFSQMNAASLVKPSEPELYAGLSTELEKTHPALIKALRPLVPTSGGTMITRLDVTPEALSDLGTLNTELDGLLDTLRQIQKNRDVTITAQTEDAHRHLGALSTQLEGLKPAPLVLEAETEPAHEALLTLEQTITDMPPLQVKTEDAHKALDTLSLAIRQVMKGTNVALDADIQAALQELGLLKAVLDQMQKNRPLTVEVETVAQADPRPWIDLDLAYFTMSQQTAGLPQGLRDALAQCDKLGGMRFAKGNSDVTDGVWFNSPGDISLTQDDSEKALNALVSRARGGTPSEGTVIEEGKRIYILGLADAQGNATSNLDLSKRRAEAVKDVLSDKAIGFPMVALPLGEAGWLTGAGLPEKEDDANHRSATLYLCPGSTRFASDQGQ